MVYIFSDSWKRFLNVLSDNQKKIESLCFKNIYSIILVFLYTFLCYRFLTKNIAVQTLWATLYQIVFATEIIFFSSSNFD